MKRLGFLAIAIGAVVFLAFVFTTGKGNLFFYLAGGVVGGGAVFGFFRPDLVDLDVG
jgi:hypothetical protein